jgi:hypothetical protein
MIWHILPHASACIASDMVLLLDVRRNRYFAVPDEFGDAVRRWLRSGETAAPPAKFVRMLADSGIARPGDPEPTNGRFETVHVPDSLPEAEAAEPRVRATDIASVAIRVARTWVNLRALPIQRILRTHAVRAAGASLPPSEALAARSHSYDRARRYIPIPRNCLLDSLALDRWLGAGGGGRRLVLGATAHPFAAHCWLQAEDRILNDSYDRVSRYAPILAV